MVRGGPAFDPSSPTGVLIPTVLQMASDAMGYWMSMTCLYDPYWEADPDKVTLPVCMFHVKKIVPTRAVEVSKKRVILYEPHQDGNMSTEDFANQLRQGVMQTIVDNAVKQPTTYNMEIIVPFQPIGRYVTEGVKFVTDLIGNMASAIGDDKNIISSFFSGSMAVTKIAGQAAEIVGRLPGMNGVSYINMNSLEAMAETCRTLCMKMWTGYDYKFVLITGMTHDKQPAEDDVFRATLQLQEIPVLAISRPSDGEPPAIKRNWAVTAVSAVQGALVTPLIGITGVRSDKAGGQLRSGGNMIGTMLGV